MRSHQTSHYEFANLPIPIRMGNMLHRIEHGTVYTFSKNGALAPVIRPVTDIVNGYDDDNSMLKNGYGPVGNPNGDTYNGYRVSGQTQSTDKFGRAKGSGNSGIKISNGTGLYNLKKDDSIK